MTNVLYAPPPTTDHRPEARFWTKAGPVDSTVFDEEDISIIEQHQEASVGEPAAMALFGFAVGTLIIAFPIAGLLPSAALTAALPPVLVFAGIAQFIGGLIAFRRDNAFAGTAFCAYGANNTVVATFLLLQATGVLSATPGSPAMQMLALELYCFGAISLILMIAALRLNVAFSLVLLALVPGFTLAGMANWFGTRISPAIGQIGGYFLIVSAGLAAYAAAAMVINSTWKADALPLFPLHPHTSPENFRPSPVRGVVTTVPPLAQRMPEAGSTEPAPPVTPTHHAKDPSDG